MSKLQLISKKLLFSLFFILCSFVFIPQVKAQDSSVTVQNDTKVNIYFFYSNTCPHCKEEKPFLGFLKEEYGDKLNIYAYEVSERHSVEVIKKVAAKMGLQTGSVPITIFGDQAQVGWGNSESSGLPMKEKIESCFAGTADFNCNDQVIFELSDEELAIGEITFKNIVKKDKREIEKLSVKYGLGEEQRLKNKEQNNVNVSTTFSIPFFGTYDAKNFSLPVLSLVIGLLDGFNPCAMWVLVFLISLLLGLKDSRKMWIFGITFIVASAFVYFLFMTAWLNTFLFIGVVPLIRIGIAVLALVVGIYQLREYKLHGDECKITGNEKRQRTLNKLKDLVSHQNVLLALAGLIALAFAVNLVELMCSAGFPAIFTSVLAMSDLPFWQYYWYIFLYLLMFMIDDIIVFIIAMRTLETKVVGEKYAKYSKLIGGILMVLIGLLLIIKPELLMFG